MEVGDYLRADGPFEGKYDHFDPVLRSKERHGVELNVIFFFVNCTSAS
jgi:hypothetical protein